MSDINWKDGAVCFAYNKQWFHRNGDADGVSEADLVSESGGGVAGTILVIDRADFQLNEIRVGDFIPESEIDTEQKYNEVAEVFGLFGFEFKSYGVNHYNAFKIGENLACCDDGLFQTYDDTANCKRQLTYHQIIAIGKLKRMMLDKVEAQLIGKSNLPEIPDSSDQVKNPTHYHLIEGVESIEIIARSMTKEQWKGFCLGNMLKYRIRAGKKDALKQDIEKANFYGELYEMHKEKCYDQTNHKTNA